MYYHKNILDKCNLTPKTIYGDTDSVFIDFNLVDKKTGKDYKNDNLLKFAIDLGIIAGDLIKSKLEYPHDLEYEKTFYPFAIFSKKRYVGNKYEFDYNKFKQNSMGIVLKRRDNAPIVKEVIGGIINILLNEINISKSIKYMDECIDNLLNGKYHIKYFITSKTLKANYADRTKIPHVCLADRIELRDPGNAPNTNDRIQYVAIKIDDSKILKEKIEKNNILMNQSLELFKSCNIKTINNLYDQYKNNKSDEYIKKIKLELYGNVDTDQKLPNNVYDKIYKDYLKFMEKIDSYRNMIEEEEIKLKIKDLIITHGSTVPNIIQGDRVESPEYILENNIPIDYSWYLTNQIFKSSSTIL